MRIDPTLSSVSLAESNYAGLRFQIAYVPIDQLRSNGDNTRRHSRVQIRRIARSIKKHGFLVPVVIHGDGLIASGNARVEAARLCGLEEIPVIRAEHLSNEQMQRYCQTNQELVRFNVCEALTAKPERERELKFTRTNCDFRRAWHRPNQVGNQRCIRSDSTRFVASSLRSPSSVTTRS